MAAAETGTHARLKAQRKELIGPKLAECRGRVAKLMGDGTLMEFDSVVHAVHFAVDVQRAVAERNATLPEAHRLVYRIDIKIGDIIVEGDDIYGNGMNVAARLGVLAEPDGICVSRNVLVSTNVLMAGSSGGVPGGRLLSRKRPSTPASR